MSYNEGMRRVAQFASTDETRINLGYCVHDKDSKALVATDGHRAIFDRSLYMEGRDAFSARVWNKTNEYLKPDFELKFPNIKMFYPDLDKYTQTITWAVPEWVGKLKGKKAVKGYMTLDNDITLTRPTHTPHWICLDLKLLAPLAGGSVRFGFKRVNDKDGNFEAIDRNSPIYFMIDKNVDGVIMPMRD